MILLNMTLPLHSRNQQLWLPSQKTAPQHFIMYGGGAVEAPSFLGEPLTEEEEKARDFFSF